MTTTSMSLAIANGYGNFDLTSKKLPSRYVHVKGKRLQPLCRKLKIKFLEAVVGFEGSRCHGYKPIKNGVIVSKQAAPKLAAAVAAREADPRNIKRSETDAQRRKRVAAEFAERCDRLGINPNGKTAQWLRSGHIDDDEAALISAKVAYRHEATDYEQLLKTGFDRDLARSMSSESDPSPQTWDEYLDRYGWSGNHIAQVLAKVLKSPDQSHPVWFAEAVIAVKRAGLPLETLTYEAIRDAIDHWRTDRSDKRESDQSM